MSVSPDTVVSVELMYGDWAQLCLELAGFGYPREAGVLWAIESQIPTLTPTNLAAVVVARVPDRAELRTLILASRTNAEDVLSWRDIDDGDWHEHGAIEVTEVLSKGIPWPHA